MESKNRTLDIHKDTLRALTQEELSQVAGGTASWVVIGCASFTVPKATYRGSGCGETAVTVGCGGVNA